jgi:hypothetical protein
MSLLEPGRRIFVNVPGTGYVGVGTVEAPAVRGSDFMVTDESGATVPISKAPQLKGRYGFDVDDEDKAEFFAKVRWTKTVPLDGAIKEIGLFGNQNSVCKPTAQKWTHTVKRVSELFGLK